MSVRFHEEIQPYLVPIDSIQQHPDNPNNGDVDVIVESILFNGFYGVIVAQKSTGNILAGNHRYAALLSLKATQAPVSFIDVDDEGALRILIGDNRIAELAVRNLKDLEHLLRVLEDTDHGIAGTGFDEEGMLELKRLNNIGDHASFEKLSHSTEETSLSRPVVVLYGKYDAGYAVDFSHDEIDKVVRDMRELGYNAVGRIGEDDGQDA